MILHEPLSQKAPAPVPLTVQPSHFHTCVQNEGQKYPDPCTYHIYKGHILALQWIALVHIKGRTSMVTNGCGLTLIFWVWDLGVPGTSPGSVPVRVG
jgi:hypothetical protein